MPESVPSSTGNDDWRGALDGFLPSNTPAGQAEPMAQAGEPIKMALQFEVREVVKRTAQRWNGPLSQSARPGADSYLLGVRPVMKSARGWTRGTLTWSNIQHLANRLNLEPTQHLWFCQFGALHRAAGPATPDRDSSWIFLDEFVNPVLWNLLEQAAGQGISLVGINSGVQVHLRSEAALQLNASRILGGIRVEPQLLLDAEPANVNHIQAIALHGIYTFDLARPSVIELAPLDEPLQPEHLKILNALTKPDRDVLVPPSGEEEFLSGYLPGLRQRVEVVSADRSVQIPALDPPVLLLHLAFGAKHTVSLSWRWETSRRAAPIPPLDPILTNTLPAVWFDEASSVPLPVTLRGLEAAEFCAEVLPRIGRAGVRVETSGTRPDYRQLTGTPKLKITAVATQKHDWFDLGVVVTVDERTIPFVPLFKALAKGRRKLMMVDGSYLSLNHPAFEPLAELISEARDLSEWETGIPISRHQISLWSDFEDVADESTPAVEWRSLLAEVKEVPAPVGAPTGLHAELRPYQATGLSWLAFLWRHQLGGILADDMGLGKTLQCLALIQMQAEQPASTAGRRAPFLVVAPTSVVSNWVAEIARFTPGLVAAPITATQAKSGELIASVAAGVDIVVTSYALLRLDFAAYRDTVWAGAIFDEAQFLKNASSQIHECALELPVGFKLAVTGTPMENSLIELHSLFQIVAPGLFPSGRRFAAEYVASIEKNPVGIMDGPGAGWAPEMQAIKKDQRLAKLRQRIRPFMLRRTKDVVAAELPAKQEQSILVDLAPEHRNLYDLFLQRERQKLFGLLPDLDRNRFIVFRSLTLLRLLALDASLLGDEYAGVPSSKLDVLMEQLKDVVAEGHRALIFSQFTTYLGKAAQRLDAAGITYTYLDGSTRKRDEAIAEFTAGSASVFLISLKAGGFGLNLTQADYVFLLDPWWNPATEEQAIDRTHRIGQTKNVMVYRLIAANTIEERVLALKARKAALFDAVIDDKALFSSALTADEIRGLLD